MENRVIVENIKCGGCAHGIKQKLTAIEGINRVEINVDSGEICFDVDTDVDHKQIVEVVKQKLLSMGYPEQGSVEGIKAVGIKAKSFVSCALGKMSE